MVVPQAHSEHRVQGRIDPIDGKRPRRAYGNRGPGPLTGRHHSVKLRLHSGGFGVNVASALLLQANGHRGVGNVRHHHGVVHQVRGNHDPVLAQHRHVIACVVADEATASGNPASNNLFGQPVPAVQFEGPAVEGVPELNQADRIRLRGQTGGLSVEADPVAGESGQPLQAPGYVVVSLHQVEGNVLQHGL